MGSVGEKREEEGDQNGWWCGRSSDGLRFWGGWNVDDMEEGAWTMGWVFLGLVEGTD